MRFDNHVHVKPLHGTTYDIWWGIGWLNWARVTIDFGKKKVDHNAGTQMPFHIRQSVVKYLKVNESA